MGWHKHALSPMNPLCRLIGEFPLPLFDGSNKLILFPFFFFYIPDGSILISFPLLGHFESGKMTNVGINI